MNRTKRHHQIERYFQKVVLTYEDTADCLIWPFSRYASTGYARMGRSITVSRRLCEEVNGPAPSPEMHAAHSCGKGKFGCVTKKHLLWKTPVENEKDKEAHGTTRRGERHSQRKIDRADADKIILMRGKYTQRQLADMFGIGQTQVCRIQNKQRWEKV